MGTLAALNGRYKWLNDEMTRKATSAWMLLGKPHCGGDCAHGRFRNLK
jgi:hypothetical protein